MSGFFKNDVVYIIVPTADITNEMINNMKKSFYAEQNTQRTTNDTTQTLFKVKEPISNAFNGYVWYNEDTIAVEMAKAEWNPT